MKLLTKEQKGMLVELQGHRWYKLLLELTKEFEYDVLNRLKNIDLSNEKEVSILMKNQNYLKGVSDFISTLNTWTNKIGRKDFN